MPIPSFKDTLDGTLMPGITIIQGGNYFDTDDNVDNLDIAKMNAELARTTKSEDIVFIQADAPKEDLTFNFFLKSQKK